MPIPLIPVAGVVISTGTVALAGYRAYHKISKGRRDQRAEDALDDVSEGATIRTDGTQANGTFRWKRVIRLGDAGPAFEIDASAFARFKIKKVD